MTKKQNDRVEDGTFDLGCDKKQEDANLKEKSAPACGLARLTSTGQ